MQPTVQSNMAHTDDFAGMNEVFTSSGSSIVSSWIMDTGATNHMCVSSCSLDNSTSLSRPALIHLPDGSTQTVTHAGHDLKTRGIMAVGKRVGNLYLLNNLSFEPAVISSYVNNDSSCFASHTCDDSLWHKRLGHPSPIVPQILEHYFIMIRTQFQLDIKTVRSDNGTEFTNAKCQSLFTSLGILHQTTCSYTPQQNGVVERKHRHVLEVARSLLFQSHLPKRFWGESILAATYLINRLPSSILDWKLPFELLYKKPPALTSLKVFGCLCYATKTMPHKLKFDKRVSKRIFLGYCQSKKAYKVYDLDSNTLFASRDVIFHESIFPFQSLPSTTENISLPLPISDFQDSSVQPEVPPHPLLLKHIPLFQSYDVLKGSLLSRLGYPIMNEPQSYIQACKDQHWVDAMNQELRALADNQTWVLTSLPPGKRTIGSRWVYKVKLKPDGTVDRYKARLVAKGYNQIEGIDYLDSFFPVAKSVTVCLLLSLATSKSWPLLQLDVNNAFLHSHLEEDVYMEPPAGLLDVIPGQVCKLQNSLYGLKQASRQWNLELTTQLLAFGFRQSSHEHCLFIKRSASEFTVLLVYVDDIILTGSSEHALQSIKDHLHRLFTIKDLGPAKYFLGLEIARSSHGLHVSQHKYLLDILTDCSILNATPAPTPLPFGLKLVLDDGALLPDPGRYRHLVGRLLYLGFTRPNISFIVQQLSQFLQAPRTSHWDAALHVLRYLKGTSSTGLFFSSSSSVQLSAFSDASWASYLDSRRCVTGYCVFLGSSLISWKTEKQATVSRSSAEAEYRAMASTVCELLWFSFVMRDSSIPVNSPIPFWCDNKAALHITANLVFHERTKHLDIDCHLVRDQYKLGFISPSHIPGSDQVANVFTKSLPTAIFTRLLSKLGLSSSAPP
ncbi:UNVERIFIED_CONTAM: Retrovirus-related Pol polyprotein from transposon RE2 [Sesamum indicum]